uniref:Protein phosphatase 1G n=1 Tax=Amphilophus citrinellus TaxID=61819 RepID=A0A3Q0RFY2_AMPCI
MGAYLSQPNTTKTSSDGGNSNMSYGFSAMQGWRVSMEDAHNCIPEFDEETAMFAVYDGHGEIVYCAVVSSSLLHSKNMFACHFQALEDAFLAIDGRITTEEVIKELVQIAGRPTEEPPTEKVAEEDDLDTEEAALLHEEATMTIEELLVRYGQNHLSVTALSLLCAYFHSWHHLFLFSSSLTAADSGADSGSSNGEEKAGKAEGDAGPSCSSSSSKVAGDSKSRFFDDSESEGEEEEEASEEEDVSEDEDGDSSELEEEEDTEEGEEDSEDEDEEEMCLPGMDGKEEPGSDSGTTAVVALIRGKQLIVANAGDSRCVVSERGKAVDMSYDHKPEDEVELARIKNAGGKVTMDGRVNGGLNLSRAIGDHFYKRNKSLPPEEQMISAMPDVKVLTLNEDHDFMVIACDGIWNVLSSQEVVDFISERIKPDQSGKARPLSSIVEELLDHCLAPDTSGDGTGCDNMTCVIISFRPHSSSTESDDTKKRKHAEEGDGTEQEKNGNDSKKAKSD